MRTPGKIHGRVLLNNAPLRHFGVLITKVDHLPMGGEPIEIRSDTGRFEVPHAEGVWNVSVMGPGTRRLLLENVRVEEQKVIDLGDVVLQNGDVVSGRVCNESGVPIPAALVVVGHPMRQARSPLIDRFSGLFSATSDASGAFVFDGIDPRLSRRPNIFSTHSEVGASIICPLPRGNTPIELVLLDVGEIRGVIQGFRGGWTAAYADRIDEPFHIRASMVTADGRFHFERVPVGTYVVSLDISKPERGSATVIQVAANHVAHVELQMFSCSVQLVIVAPEQYRKVTLVSALDDDNLNQLKPNSVMTMNGTSKVNFNYLPAGEYRILIDGESRDSILVPPSPVTQLLEWRPLRDNAGFSDETA